MLHEYARLLGAAFLTTMLASGLAHADVLHGRVLGPDGQPVAGAQVAVSGVLSAPVTVMAGADGRFAIDVPPGIVTVWAWAAGMAAPPQQVSAGTEVALALAVRAVSETLIVTASHVAAPLSAVPDSVTVITRDELVARQATTLGDALRLVPGFAIARTGGPGTVTSAFPRGGESDYTLVLVDGVRANAFGGGLDLSQVPIADAERIEVVRGPQSALHGSDAIGGVVQIITAKGGPLTASGSGEFGGREARSGRALVRTGAGPWYGAASAAYDRDAGFTGKAEDGTTVTNDDGTVAQLSATLGWRHAAGTDLAGSVQFVETERGSPGPYGSNPAGNFGGVDRAARGLTRRRSAALRFTQPLGGAASRVRLRADADRADFDLEFRSALGSRGETGRTHGRVQLDAAVSRAVAFSAGVDGVREHGASTFITDGTAAIPVERAALAAFAEARWQPHDRLAVSAGARAERITRDALAANPSAFSARPAFLADTVTSINPKVAASWVLVPEAGTHGHSTRLRGAAGTGIRPPDAFEIAFTDNPGLTPERSRGVEAGVTQTLAGGAVQADATWFQNTYDDLIISIGRLNSTSRYTTDNIANARARGAELALAWRPTAALSARGTYTFLDTEVRAVDGAPGQAPPPFRVGDRLLRRPRHQGSVDVIWSHRRLQSFATAALRGTTLDVEPNFGTFGGLFENAGHAVVTTGAAVTIAPHLIVYGRIANVFGARYEDVFGYPALGRTAYVGIRVAARR
ncbi:MAG TPA: TonB-dependent receptor [Vicinamibacterales bacterium]|nr:TonB-dependent receptor [Vicinamibacterales bacterium]